MLKHNSWVLWWLLVEPREVESGEVSCSFSLLPLRSNVSKSQTRIVPPTNIHGPRGMVAHMLW